MIHKSESLNKLSVEKAGIKILCVDDEELIRDVMQLMLEDLGHEVDAVHCGAEALRNLDTKSYDLLITDIGMPQMSGWQLLEQIAGKYPDMKITVLTGWGSDIQEDKKSKYGVDFILGKPSPRVKLAALVDKVLALK
ncbi:MAG: response regulator [Spirochaetales bacterium]|nr:response regulator [Spirochaetales bacterium]